MLVSAAADGVHASGLSGAANFEDANAKTWGEEKSKEKVFERS